MARKEKEIIIDGIDKREVGYYSTPSFIAKYLTEAMLAIFPDGNRVLDPAVGKEELLPYFYRAGKSIDSIDIIDWGQPKRYSAFSQCNFIDYYAEMKNSGKVASYDYFIANPPYNCHEISYIKENKKKLKALFPVGAYNMYSMFLSAMIDIAQEGSVIGVIICDSFLTSKYHEKLRQQIFESCSIHQLILCPSDLFWSEEADVRTCILVLQKGTKYQGKIKVSNRPSNTSELKEILESKRLKEVDIQNIRLGDSKDLNQIIIDVDDSIVSLFYSYPKLGSLFPCVTCISTGNDSKYLSLSKREGFSVPFYKNPASRKFVATPDAYLIDNYLDESQRVKDFMVRNKQYLTKEGIACSSMGLPFSAVYLPSNAVTGVNPTIFPPEKDINWLIAYLNSSLVTYLIRGVLIRSNMVTSGYVSNLPVLPFTDEEKRSLDEITDGVRKNRISVKDAVSRADTIIFRKGLFGESVISTLREFSQKLSLSV